MAVTDQYIELDQFFGVNRSVPEHKLGDGWLRVKSNFGTDDRGSLTKARGARNVTSASAAAIGTVKQLHRYYYGTTGKRWLAQGAGALASGTSTGMVFHVSSTYTEVGRGFSLTKTRHFYTFGDISLSVNDYDAMQHYEGTNTMAAATYSAPSSPVITSGSAGSLTGIYAYKFAHTYLHDTFNAGPTSPTLQITSKKINVTIPATTAPILGVTIYRTRDLSSAPGTASQLYYLAYVSGTAGSTHIDNALDTALVIDESQLCATTKINAPTCQYGCMFQRRNITGGGDTYSDRFYVSEFNKPYTYYPLSFYRVEDDITALGEWRNELYVLQKGSIARLRGVIGVNAVLEHDLAPGVGTPAPKSVCFTPNGIFFLSNDKTVRFFDGYNAAIISEPVKDYLNSAQATYLASAAGAFIYNKYYLWFSNSGASNNQCAVFDTIDKTWYTGPALYPTVLAVADKQGDDKALRFAHAGHVYQAETGNAVYRILTASGGTASTSTYVISAQAVSTVFDMGIPGKTKQIRKVEVTWTGGDGTEYIEFVADRGMTKKRLILPADTVEYAWGSATSRSTDFVWAESADDDYGGVWGRATTDCRQQTFGVEGGVAGRVFQIQITASGTTAFSLKRIRVFYWHFEV